MKNKFTLIQFHPMKILPVKIQHQIISRENVHISNHSTLNNNGDAIHFIFSILLQAKFAKYFSFLS